MAEPFLTDSVIKIFIAFALGAALGAEREIRRHPAGLRTHILVTIGSASVTLVGYLMMEQLQGQVPVDPSRVVQGVVTGIGFLGAGAILKIGADVKGLTTAASIWIASSVGIMVASDAVALAILVTGLAVLTLSVMQYIELKFHTRAKSSVLAVRGVKPDMVAYVHGILDGFDVHVGRMGFKRSGTETAVNIRISMSERFRRNAIILRLLKDPDITEAYWRDATVFADNDPW